MCAAAIADVGVAAQAHHGVGMAIYKIQDPGLPEKDTIYGNTGLKGVRVWQASVL